jgi:hypothetical protein
MLNFLNFLHFDEVDYSLSLPKLLLVTKLEQNDPSVENGVNKLQMLSNFLAAQQCNSSKCCGNFTPTRLFI